MVNGKYNILVNGTGNIGTSLVQLLVKYREDLLVNEIYASKRSLHAWNQVELDLLTSNGVKICTTKKVVGYDFIADVLPEIDYIFEASPNGVGVQNKGDYEQLTNLKGSSAQGSEKGYGIPFMSGINSEQIKNQRFVNIVSCNTHGTASILKLFCGENLENLDEADVVVVRRCEDLGNHQRLVSGNVVARHLHPTIGTHHAIDVVDMFKTKNISCALTSSDITTPSQLMHSIRFHISLKAPLSKSIDELVNKNPFIATTQKFDSNVIFEYGRRYGFNGRIFSHAILLSENMLVSDRKIKGWAFVPQEGNSLISTLHAYLLQLNFANESSVLAKIQNDLLRKKW
jgi:glyceraldehyde-3-phosphate dehydrogenase type II